MFGRWCQDCTKCLLFSLSGSDVDECSDRVLACHGLDEICTNTEGSFHCDCAEGFIRRDGVCVRKQQPSEYHHTHTNTHTHRRMFAPMVTLPHSGLSYANLPCAGVQERGLFEDIQDDEVEVLQQMFFGVVLCALATMAAKGDLVYTSVFMGALAAMTGYWLSDRGDRLLDNFLKGRLD